jgi:PAS domain-containing protein
MAKTQPQWRNRITGYAEIDPAQLLANPLNFRIHPRNQQAALSGLIDEIGFIDPVLVQDGTDMVIDGHLRVSLALRDGIPTVPVQYVDLTDAEANLALASFDPIAAMAGTDADNLAALLDQTSTTNADVMAMLSELAEANGVVDFDGSGGLAYHEPTFEELTGPPEETPETRTLADRFLVPPFSVLDARQGYWQTRKRAWLAIGIKSELGRGENALRETEGVNDLHDNGTGPYAKGNPLTWRSPQINEAGLNYYRSRNKDKASPGVETRPAMKLGDDGKTVRGDGHGRGLARTYGQDLMKGEHVVGSGRYLPTNAPDGESSGTSVFDPVLTELAYRWFCPPNGAILDPFAGGSVRGIVAARLGRQYTGIDLSGPQLAANELQAQELTPDNPPTWIEGDSANVRTLVPDDYTADFLFSCPPYADLEVYSDDPRDLSTMDYADFLTVYRTIIAESVALLNPDRFACFVVGDVRGPNGVYRNFVSDTIAAFQDAGAMLYNDAILVTAVGSLPIRVGRQFEAGRKLGKTHQNVLVFVKGDGRKATDAVGPVDMSDALFVEEPEYADVS